MNEIAVVKSQIKLENWAEMVRSRSTSGLTVEQWCRENGIGRKTYYYRQRKVRQAALAELKDTSENSSEVPVFGKLDLPLQNATSQPAITVHLPYATLEIGKAATEQTIKAVLMALKSTC